MGGRVEIASVKGVGAALSFRLPLAIVLSRIAVVKGGGGLYGVPLDAVVELARVPRAAVTPVRAGRAFTLREHAIALVSLDALVGAPLATEAEELRVMIVRCGADLVGVAIDGVVEQIEAVVQPMRGLLAGLRGFSGTTLRGDGSVLLVLNVEELIG
jgi:two-component system chemotaxis sensor kinase CheA